MSASKAATTKKTRSGGDSRGSAETRRARKWWMLKPGSGVFVDGTWVEFGGDGEKVPCIHCHRMLTFETVEADRIVPGSKGGTYRRTNVQPSCRQCNASRNDNEEWTYATHRAPKLDVAVLVDEVIEKILDTMVDTRSVAA